MSRPASESVGAVKRVRTASLCADSVERAYSIEHPTYVPTPSIPVSNTSNQRTNPRKRLRSHPTLPGPAQLDFPYPTTQIHYQPDQKHRRLSAIEHRTVAPLPQEDDAEGHLIYKHGQGLHPTQEYPFGRYKILGELGEGTFGKVVECWDRKEEKMVAIKVVRSVAKYREAAKLEIDVLLHLKQRDPDGIYHCVELYSWFDYHSHICMVFEKLGPSLYEHLRRNRFEPFSLDQVREYAFQLLECVHFVHNLTLIHTDLKPENILFTDNRQIHNIKLIDFGSATFESQHHSAVISTRHYRAPEVILGLGWTYPCDLWSVGCILVELYTGQALFQTHENLEHLAMMSGVLGPIPDSMIRRADGSSQKYFSRLDCGRMALNWPAGASSKDSIRSVRRVQALKDIIRCSAAHANFFDLVAKLLAFEPDSRYTTAEALQHPFFRESPVRTDLQIQTPTISSGSSACGSNLGNASRERHGRAVRKRTLPQLTDRVSRRVTRRGNSNARRRVHECEEDDTATEMQAGAEHSDHTVAAIFSPHQRRLTERGSARGMRRGTETQKVEDESGENTVTDTQTAKAHSDRTIAALLAAARSTNGGG